MLYFCILLYSEGRAIYSTVELVTCIHWLEPFFIIEMSLFFYYLFTLWLRHAFHQSTPTLKKWKSNNSLWGLFYFQTNSQTMLVNCTKYNFGPFDEGMNLRIELV